MRKFCVVLLAVVGGALFAPTANTTANAEAVYRRFDGSTSDKWKTATNWSGDNVPNATDECADFDGDNNGVDKLRFQKWFHVDTTIGQLRIKSPVTVRGFNGMWNGNLKSVFTLSPSAYFEGIGLDMSAATVDFTLDSGSGVPRNLVLKLGESQQWNVTSTSASGNLVLGTSARPYNDVELQSYALTANVGTGRLIDSTYATFRGAGGSVIKTGDGELRLGMANTYTGDTTIHGGTLKLTGSGTIDSSPTIVVGDAGSSGAVLQKSSGTFNVGSTQTLKGIGTVIGDVSVAAGGTLAPGASGVGTLTFGNSLTLNDNALLVFELAGTGASDLVTLTGSNQLTIGSGLLEWDDFVFADLGATAGTYTLFDTGAPIVGTLGTSLTGTVGSLEGTLSLANADNDLVLTLASSAGPVIPEPSAFLIWALGLLGLPVYAWRRKR